MMEYTQGQWYSIDREKIAHYLNFKLRERKPPEEALSFEDISGADTVIEQEG